MNGLYLGVRWTLLTKDMGSERVHMVHMLDVEGVRMGGGESADLTHHSLRARGLQWFRVRR